MSLRLIVDNLKSRNVSESHVSLSAETSAQGARSAFCDSFGEPRLIRKKSGQLVKSSLKSSKSATLSIFTVPSTTKSEPTTPTSKAVHFDAKLEHVKLFLAEQKPLAVSRDGSPTDETSGTDSDFPKFIYGDGDDWRPKKKLLMQLSNMPAKICPNSDVALEHLSLTADGTSILGRVRVRNIAFAKWVAVRFTFDSWQTTSEVTGKYMDSPEPEFDRFTFTIRLNDLLARIEGKTMRLAIRYSVDAREIWDNNNGQNYLATFSKAKAEEKRSTSLSDDEASTDMADLRSKLEKVVNSDDRTGPAFLAQRRRRPAPADPDTVFKTSTSFASRYDFATSLKSPWKPSASAIHNRTQSLPLSTSSKVVPSSTIPWPQKGPADVYSGKRSPPKSNPTLGSPRDIDDDAFRVVSHQPSDVDNPPFHVHPRGTRNHQRGYFDLSITTAPPGLKRTPPGTPLRSPDDTFSPTRFNSFPPMEGPRSAPLYSTDINTFATDSSGDSELSTPSMATPSSSRSSTPSPTEMFTPGAQFLSDDENMEALSPDTHYRQFLNKFCFFTGPGAMLDQAVDLPRTQSASDIEEFLSGVAPHLQSVSLGSISPTRSSSLDDLMLNRSGSLTPTISRLSLAKFQNATPVLS
ncbi:putative phosphatase regulatory subunit-domain-containing protein [Crassisporium funariophilum]|nr:putative phosphatase regulatory subunit-domain-containing protein [Crassisporium funariophilum]